ncbi:hypothetical protein BH20CHL6_BH20CHL6_01960 [soil metagenome]
MPVRAIWGMFTSILGLTGRIVAIALGVVLLILGGLLTATGILAVLGVPLLIFGGLLVLRAVL